MRNIDRNLGNKNTAKVGTLFYRPYITVATCDGDIKLMI